MVCPETVAQEELLAALICPDGNDELAMETAIASAKSGRKSLAFIIISPLCDRSNLSDEELLESGHIFAQTRPSLQNHIEKFSGLVSKHWAFLCLVVKVSHLFCFVKQKNAEIQTRARTLG
ncbi:MAG: hypothetical protein L0Z73_17200 [Gammaproteobacteria bacterium]|nr:hypothetical protein [Gammaproteobacteria bacterium]